MWKPFTRKITNDNKQAIHYEDGNTRGGSQKPPISLSNGWILYIKASPVRSALSPPQPQKGKKVQPYKR